MCNNNLGIYKDSVCIEIHCMFNYTACWTASDHYLVKYLVLEDFSCISHKCVALALLAKFIAVLVSKMECFSVPAPNACNGSVLDFLAHFLLHVVDIPRSIKACCALKRIAHYPPLLHR